MTIYVTQDKNRRCPGAGGNRGRRRIGVNNRRRILFRRAAVMAQRIQFAALESAQWRKRLRSSSEVDRFRVEPGPGLPRSVAGSIVAV